MFHALNFVALRFIWLMMPAGFGIVSEHNIPEELPINETVAVNWAVHKGELEGFAKLTFDLPDHLSVSMRNANGATFSFENQQAKLIWMDMPKSGTLAIGLDLMAHPGFVGGAIDATFSFVRSGQRVDLPLDGAVVRADRATLPLGYAFYQGMRTLQRLDDNRRQVEIQVASEPTEGFLKIEEQLPLDCTAEILESGGATTSQLDRALKFVWFEAPKEPNFELSYVLTCQDPKIFNFSWSGEIAYVSDDRPMVKKIITTTGGSTMAQTSKSSPEPESKSGSEPEANITPIPDEIPTNPKNDLAGVIRYRVQIMAAHGYVSEKWVRNRFGFEVGVAIDEQDDWYKYTTGEEENYVKARNLREQLSAQFTFPGPFVTAYLRGERITVQEALALSSQQWTP